MKARSWNIRNRHLWESLSQTECFSRDEDWSDDEWVIQSSFRHGWLPSQLIEGNLSNPCLYLFALHIRLHTLLPPLKLGLLVFFQKTPTCPHLWVPISLPTPSELPLWSETLPSPPNTGQSVTKPPTLCDVVRTEPFLFSFIKSLVETLIWTLDEYSMVTMLNWCIIGILKESIIQ